MAKFYGYIGYAETTNTSPGVTVVSITEKECKGDLIRNTQQWQNAETLNDDISINNRFSIVIDPYIESNMANMRYVKWKNIKWKIKDFEFKRPRVILTVSGVWNGN